jgi:sugar lactone lactonase YvrE
MTAELFIQAECILGESPMWHKERNSLWWVDIEAGIFFECNIETKIIKKWRVQQSLSLLVQSAKNSNTLILAVSDGLLQFNIDKNEFERILFIEKNLATNRTNDGGCDANGRLWLGTMDITCAQGAGKLYCIGNDLQVNEKIETTSISNGLCWSLAQDRFYYIDSATYKVDSYFFDIKTAEIIFEKTVVEIPEDFGMPDGMAMDEEGMLWIANWGGFTVNRWNPVNGVLLEVIVLPVPNVSSCAFGGENMDLLFITTARSGLSDVELEEYPLSGGVFVAYTTVAGKSKNKCSL